MPASFVNRNTTVRQNGTALPRSMLPTGCTAWCILSLTSIAGNESAAGEFRCETGCRLFKLYGSANQTVTVFLVPSSTDKYAPKRKKDPADASQWCENSNGIRRL